MRGNELLDRMDLIDPEYVEAAEQMPAKKTRIPTGWIATAACLCILLAGAIAGIRPVTSLAPTETTDQTIPSTVTVPITIIEPIVVEPEIIWEPYYNEYEDTGIVSDSKRVQIPGYFIEELSQEEIYSLTPQARMLWMELSGHAGFNGEGELIDLFLTITTSDPESDVSLFVSQYGTCDCIIIEQEPRVSLCGSIDYTLYQRDSQNGRTYFTAETEYDDWFWSFSMDVQTEKAEQAKQDFQSILACFSNYIDRGTNLDSITPEYIPDYFDYQLSQAEALDDPAFGAYFPQSVPEGYAVESIHRYMDYQCNYLSGLWSRGYDDLYWYVSRISDEEKGRITAVSDTENYDLSLYPIPRADSVPEELREIVDNPIFLAEELTLEVVKARAYQIQDAGDTDGWRMHFSVLYGDILVEIRTKGVDPEWIYDQIISLIVP